MLRVLRAPPLLAGGAIGACTLLLFAPVLLRGEYLFFRDVLNYYWPTRHAAALAWASGEIPQWNPFQQAGLPLLADIHAGVLYPGNLLFQFLPFPAAYTAFIMVHHSLLGLGVVALLRRLGCMWFGAVTGGIVLMLSGCVVGLVNAGPLMAGLSLVPWSLWAIAAPKATAGTVVVAASLLGLQALCGDPQSVLYSAVGALLLVATLPERRRRALLVVSAFLLAGALAGVQLAPSWQLWKLSSRAVATAGPVEWSFHPVRLLELIAPFPWGHYLEEPKFWAGPLFKGPVALPFSLSVYMGASALALIGVGRHRGRIFWFGAALVAVGFVLAASSHLSVGGLIAAGPFAFFRYPEKYVVLMALGVAVCAADASSTMLEALPSWRSLVLVAAVFVLPTVGLCVGLVDPGALMLVLFPQLGSGAKLASTTIAGALFAGSAGATAVLAAIALARLRRSAASLKALLPVVVAADLLAAAVPLIWGAGADLFRLRSPVGEGILAIGGGEGRFFRDDYALRQVAPPSRDAHELRERRAWELLTLRSNLATVHGMEEMGGYGAVELERTMSVVKSLRAIPSRLMQVFAARHVITIDGAPITQDPRIEKVGDWPALGVSLFENRAWLPKLNAVARVNGTRSAEQALERLRDPAIDLSEVAVVEGVESFSLAKGELKGVRFSQHRAKAQVSAKAPGTFVVFSSARYPGWRAFVDGREQPLWSANGLGMGLVVPEGVHEVEFVFTDRMLGWGLGSSLLGMALSLALVANPKRRWRRLRGRCSSRGAGPN